MIGQTGTSEGTLDGLKVIGRDLTRRGVGRCSRPLRILSRLGEYRQRLVTAKHSTIDRPSILDGLRADGFSLLGERPNLTDELVTDCVEKFEARGEFKQRGNKAFFSQLLAGDDYHPEGIFMQFALDETLLRTVASYLQCAPYLNSLQLLYSRPVSGPVGSSQLWHRDERDASILKVFVYVTNVAEEHGPLTLLPKSDSSRIPSYLPHYLSDGQVARYVPLAHAVTILGASGTVAMVDTDACYHLGSRCRQPRLVFLADYSRGFGYTARETDWRSVLHSIPEDLSMLQRLALGVA
jgi:hypothetical protein